MPSPDQRTEIYVRDSIHGFSDRLLVQPPLTMFLFEPVKRSRTLRLSPRPVSDCPWYLRPFFWNQKRKYGAALDASLMWARVPRLFIAIAHLYGVLDRRSSPISPALRSLVTVRVSQLNGCRFCIDLNSYTLMKRGVPLEKVGELATWQDSDRFSEVERLALEYAEAMTLSGREVDEANFNNLKLYFDDDALMELTALIAFQNLSSKFNAALDIPPQGFCNLPGGAGRTETEPSGPMAPSGED